MPTAQLDLFNQAGVEVIEPDQKTEVRLGSRRAFVNLPRKRRVVLEEFAEVLAELEGKDVFITHDTGNYGHFSSFKLKLGHLRVETFVDWDKETPSMIWLRGSREGGIRIDTDRVVNLRRQDYFGYTMWLLDFWNGFGEYPIDPYRKSGYDSLQIVRFKD